MPNFINQAVTSAGVALIAKGLAGAQIVFTKICIGDGNLASGTDLTTVTGLVDTIATLSISKCQLSDNQTVVVGGTFDNSAIQTGFYYRELGLFANDPDNGEVLFCYGNAGDYAEYIPPLSGGSVEKAIDVITYVGGATNVTATVTSGLYASADDLAALQETVADLQEALTEHENTLIGDENGVHGIRYFDGNMQYWNGGEWEAMAGAVSEPVGAVIAPIAYSGSLFTLSWKDPADIPGDNAYWGGTVLMRANDHYPTDISDGTMVLNNLVRDQYYLTGFTDTSGTVGNTYYYKLFTYSIGGSLYSDDSMQWTIAYLGIKAYGIQFSTNSASTAGSACTYTGDAASITPDTGWNNIYPFNAIRPCVFKNGAVQYYLNPNDFTKKDNGDNAIIGGTDGDVMIEFPRIGIKIAPGVESSNASQTITVTTDYNATDYGYDCFIANGKRNKAYMYVGAYLDSANAATFKSVSGRALNTTAVATASRIAAWSAMPDGYFGHSIGQADYISTLCLMKYRNRALTATHGTPNFRNTSAKNTTGRFNQSGMNHKSTGASDGMKVFGVEDFIGNLPVMLSGIIVYAYYSNSQYYASVYQQNIGYDKRNYPAENSSSWVNSETVFNVNTSSSPAYPEMFGACYNVIIPSNISTGILGRNNSYSPNSNLGAGFDAYSTLKKNSSTTYNMFLCSNSPTISESAGDNHYGHFALRNYFEFMKRSGAYLTTALNYGERLCFV